MNLPDSLYGNEYYENLRYFRDEALVESQWFGRRKKIGSLTLGIARSKWKTDDGGIAYLVDEGIRFGSVNLTNYLPTTLRIASEPYKSGREITTFRMDIDDIGQIEIYKSIIADGSFRDIIRTEMQKRIEKRHELNIPTDEQRELIYTEMQRGATGLYAKHWS